LIVNKNNTSLKFYKKLFQLKNIIKFPKQLIKMDMDKGTY